MLHGFPRYTRRHNLAEFLIDAFDTIALSIQNLISFGGFRRSQSRNNTIHKNILYHSNHTFSAVLRGTEGSHVERCINVYCIKATCENLRELGIHHIKRKGTKIKIQLNYLCNWKTAHFDANFIRFLLLKTLQFYILKMAASGGRHFYINIKTKNYESQVISQTNAYTYTFDKYDFCFFSVINPFIGFYEYFYFY